jgi:two-component system sensor histidine kinase BaeS
MKTRLSYKIFTAFLVMSFMVVALMAGGYRFIVERNFWDYVNQTILNRMDPFATALIAEYRAGRGWHNLADDPQRWLMIMADAMAEDDIGHAPPAGDGDTTAMQPLRDLAPAPANQPPPLRRRLARGLALFDDLQLPVVSTNPENDAAHYTLRPLILDGRTVGWLGLHKKEPFSDPLVLAFIKEQVLAFYYIGGMILALAAVASFLFSRHLLSPIRRLMQGTRDLAAFRFDARIDVRSRDELGQLARDFNRMADTLKKYEQLRRQWISDISHELRTPLAILKGEIEALQDGVRQVNADSLGSLHAEVLRLSKLVTDLHDLSLADSQNLLSMRQVVAPLAILQQMAGHYRNRMARQYIEVRLRLTDDPKVVLQGDPDRLAQLFANLLENSLRYTDAPGVLKIDEHHDAHRLTIRFEDSPPGVPDHALERIFERLYRVDSSRNRHLGGSGLGLAICKQIVEAHGGTIAASRAGLGGLLMHIDLPLDNPDPG